MREFRIGFSSQVITPPLGCQMAGFDARQGVANQVHDELHSCAFVFDDGSTVAALVSVEVIGIDRALADIVRAEIKSRTGIPASNVIVSATHTHCGPVIFNHFFNPGQLLDRVYLDQLAEAIVSTVERAMLSRKPRRLETGFARVEKVAVNRRSADGLPIDPDAGILLIREMDGTIAGIAVNYACHPTVLGPDTLAITADFPFYTAQRLRQKFGSETIVGFFNGAEGDISVGHKSHLSAVGVIAPFRTFEKARELGERVADAVIAALPGLIEQPAQIRVARGLASLPLKTYGQSDRAGTRRKRALERLRQLESAAGAHSYSAETLIDAKQEALYSRIEEYYATLPDSHAQSLGVELTAIRLGDTAIVSLPGEVFVAIALEIRARSPFPATMFVGLANDYVGYIPSESDAGEGYEIVASRVTRAATAVLSKAALQLLEALA